MIKRYNPVFFRAKRSHMTSLLWSILIFLTLASPRYPLSYLSPCVWSKSTSLRYLIHNCRAWNMQKHCSSIHVGPSWYIYPFSFNSTWCRSLRKILWHLCRKGSKVIDWSDIIAILLDWLLNVIEIIEKCTRWLSFTFISKVVQH